MCGGSMQSVMKFKTKEDIQYIVGTNVRKVCKNSYNSAGKMCKLVFNLKERHIWC